MKKTLFSIFLLMLGVGLFGQSLADFNDNVAVEVLEKIENPSKKLMKKSELVREIKYQNPEVLVTMGAGDIGLVVPKIKKELEYAN